jgi:hypothetical protein
VHVSNSLHRLGRQKAADLKFRSDIARLKLLAAVCRAKAGFNPDQPRADHGRWTDTGAERAQFEALLRALDGHTLADNVAYPGDFRDVVMAYVVKALRAGGNQVETEVSLVLPGTPPATARLDILARGPLGTLYGIDVKTDENPTFTPGQQVFIRMPSAGPAWSRSTAKSKTWGLLQVSHCPPSPSASYTREARALRWTSSHCLQNQNRPNAGAGHPFSGGNNA